MKTTNNYINLVVLGSFNPSILNHSFLVKECEMDLGETPKETSRPQLPVMSSLEYENIQFFIDLGRLQITEKNCEDPKESKIPRYLENYLRKLPYTPITKAGTNLSYRLDIEKKKIDQIEELLKINRSEICGSLKLGNLGIDISFSLDSEKETISSWTIKTFLAEKNVSTLMKFHYDSENKPVVDYNYEISGIDKDKEKIQNLTTHYGEIVDFSVNQILKVFGD